MRAILTRAQGVAGVEAQTETVWRQAHRYGFSFGFFK